MNTWQVDGYTHVRELGEGASGRVVLARHEASGVDVAIKYLSDELRGDLDFLSRFRAEARLLVELRDPHVARLYEYIETVSGAAIVMELVDGVSLRTLLRSEGPTGPEAALTVLKGSLLGLDEAHRQGIVHRDYKPENVIVQGDGASKLVDFGIAVRDGTSEVTAGTPPYMAPEQWTGMPAGPTTDVYAATTVFFECLTGQRPYRAPNLAALMYQHQAAPIPADEVPEAVRPLITRGLAKDPLDRPATAAAFVTELEEVASAAYGDDWEERGRRRLAELAGLLALLFPLAAQQPAGGTAVAETDLGEPTRAHAAEQTRAHAAVSRGRMRARGRKQLIASGVAGVVVIGGAAIFVLSGAARPELRASGGPASPSATASAPGSLPDVTAEPTPTPTETTEEPEPTDSATPAPQDPPAYNNPPRNRPRPSPSGSRTQRPEQPPPPPPPSSPDPEPTEEETLTPHPRPTLPQNPPRPTPDDTDPGEPGQSNTPDTSHSPTGGGSPSGHRQK
ncbi:serine/threonine-protein kinase [Bailinhaonella thermotolerans]|uniref:non-specific serine/threonine protein kinase n=1 Tax=Bailinhaonella thermotolerans TaxID=1070861 RepID=A0A3A4AVA3_9ACTN|nr:serine/threonine-protein kinase [Bailinhaonella thermotolerans]RJL32641.1 serine/threonine protein kinase [Bailinhaonella thermotolerans]